LKQIHGLKHITLPRANSSFSPLNPSAWKKLWKLQLNDRLKLFLWKIAWDIIPTKSRLNHFLNFSPFDLLCPLCKSETDSLSHLFFRCVFSRVAWRSSFWPLNSLVWDNLSPSQWIEGILSPHSSFGIPLADSHLFQIFASVLCDLIWFNRNKALHDGLTPNVLVLANSIKKTALDHHNAWRASSSPVKEKWSPPAAGSYKINFDTAIRDHLSAQATVCRDSNGKIIKAVSQINPPCDPNYGEALAALLASSLASKLNLQNFTIEGDSQVVIMALQNPSIVQDWKIDASFQTPSPFCQHPPLGWLGKFTEVQTSVLTM
jgi:hypothetical protein